LSLEELKQLRQLARALDDTLEESLKARENLTQTFRRLFPALLQWTGAKAVAVTTANEELQPETWSHGAVGEKFPGSVLAEHPWGVRALGDGTLVTQSLDVVGMKVGAIGLWFEGSREQPEEAQRLVRMLETIAEQLDTVLAMVHTASEKHQLIVTINQLLSHRVFESGMDQAALSLAERIRIPGLLLVYRDAVDSETLHYRVYNEGHLENDSHTRPLPALEKAVATHGSKLIAPSDQSLRQALGSPRNIEAVLISGLSTAGTLGKLIVWSKGDGFSAFAMDVIRVLAATLSQRLLDYNRERTHLSQFFSAQVIDELLRDPDYERRYLSPRDEQVGILFADINGFTRICEQVLEKPEKIGQFVDDWSQEAVEILWRHGGVFDKMVGDCVIGLFGPPFFRSNAQQRAEATVRAACEIQSFTRERMNAHPEVARISERIQLPGLGVAIGVNIAPTFCGLFGPNRAYTGFSTGMNQTARLQSLGAFRETLVMEPVRELLSKSSDPALQKLKFGELQETPVKNVAQPLRYFRLL
jgi:class 3 adenylate cyclase